MATIGHHHHAAAVAAAAAASSSSSSSAAASVDAAPRFVCWELALGPGRAERPVVRVPPRMRSERHPPAAHKCDLTASSCRLLRRRPPPPPTVPPPPPPAAPPAASHAPPPAAAAKKSRWGRRVGLQLQLLPSKTPCSGAAHGAGTPPAPPPHANHRNQRHTAGHHTRHAWRFSPCLVFIISSLLLLFLFSLSFSFFLATTYLVLPSFSSPASHRWLCCLELAISAARLAFYFLLSLCFFFLPSTRFCHDPPHLPPHPHRVV